MKHIFIFLIAASLYAPFSANAVEFPDDGVETSGRATLTWDAPTTRVDGSALSPDEIGGYEIGYGLVSDADPTIIETDVTGVFEIENIPPGTYRFAVRTVDTAGSRSGWSAAVEKNIPSRPGAPGGVTVTININISISGG